MSRTDGTGLFSGSEGGTPHGFPPCPPPVSGGELPVEQALLLEAACDAFEAQWRAGERPDIGAAVLELPESVRLVAVRELVQLDVYYRRQCGETPTAAD